MEQQTSQQNKNPSENIPDECLSNPSKFGDWLLSLYKEGRLRNHTDFQGQFTEGLVLKFLDYVIPLELEDKKNFMDKFSEYVKGQDAYSSDLKNILLKNNIEPRDLQYKLMEYLKQTRNEAEKYLAEKDVLPKEELSDLFYNLRHNIGTSCIYELGNLDLK